MKELMRSPRLPALVLALLVFGVCFMTWFQKSIEDNLTQIERLYETTQLIFQVLPGEESTTELRMNLHKGSLIQELPEVTAYMGMIRCNYSLRQPESRPALSSICGTDNLPLFAQSNNLTITFGTGWDEETFLGGWDGGVPCLMEDTLAQELQLQPGDTFVIAPTNGWDDPHWAPDITMVLSGTYLDPDASLDANGLITQEGIFLTDPNTPHLLCNSQMMYDCFYRQFTFLIDPAYNREYARIQQEAEEILASAGKFSVHTNARTLQEAVQPLERKLHLQQMLVMPLAVLLTLACAVAAVLLTLSMRTEVFLRLMWGQNRRKVFFRLLFRLGGFLLLCAGLSLVLVFITCGSNWLLWASSYTAVTVGVCLLPVSGVLMRCCGRNMVKFYQSREG